MKIKNFYSLMFVLFANLIISNIDLLAKEIMYSYIMEYTLSDCEVSDISFEKDTISKPDLRINLAKVNWAYFLPGKMKCDKDTSYSICDSVGQYSKKMSFKIQDSLKIEIPQALKIHCRYYNEKGFIERYTYSNCIVCSDLSFDCYFTYDSYNRIICISNKFSLNGGRVEIDYFSDGDIRKINVYDSNSKITKTVIFKYYNLK